jgi:hypothetical protein
MLQQKTSRRNPPKTPRVAELFFNSFSAILGDLSDLGGKNAFP